jgi:hypothetical protein
MRGSSRNIVAWLAGLAAGLLAGAALAAVPADAALPPGDASVAIQSYSGSIDTTTSIAVQLLLVWPDGADQVAVTNGDGVVQTFPVADALSWQLTPLAPTSPGDARTVTVTYSGPGIAVTRSDTIVLDSKPPRLPVQRLFQNGQGWFLAVTAEDAGAGVSGMSLLGGTGAPITGLVVCSAALCPAETTQAFFLRKARPRVARLADAAGNVKAIGLARRSTHCSVANKRYPVFTLSPGYYECVRAGDRCKPDDGHFWNRSAYVRCREVDGRFRVVAK